MGGGTQDDRLFGHAGRDILLGFSGNDRIYGGSGSNDLFGEAGDDVLFARNGSYDRVLGGRGNDRAMLDLRDLVRFVERLARR
jgi:Ca2+-binding RTX toxin-like protein